MSLIQVNNVKLHYQSVGNSAETIVFSHGYLMNNTMFNGQVDVLKDRFKCISYDHRGHGKSEVTKEGYTLENLVKDAISLIEELNLGPIHFIGMSTGGFIGMRIALQRPDLLKSLVLMDTSAEAENKKSLKQYNQLLWMIKNIGWFAVISKVFPLLFHSSFIQNNSKKEENKKWKNIITGHSKKGIIPFGKGIFSRNSVLEKLSSIIIPTAVIVGEFDVATPPDYAKRMASKIPGASFYTIPDAGHSAAIEKPVDVANAIQDFYSKNGFI